MQTLSRRVLFAVNARLRLTLESRGKGVKGYDVKCFVAKQFPFCDILSTCAVGVFSNRTGTSVATTRAEKIPMRIQIRVESTLFFSILNSH